MTPDRGIETDKTYYTMTSLPSRPFQTNGNTHLQGAQPIPVCNRTSYSSQTNQSGIGEGEMKPNALPTLDRNLPITSVSGSTMQTQLNGQEMPIQASYNRLPQRTAIGGFDGRATKPMTERQEIVIKPSNTKSLYQRATAAQYDRYI